MSTSYQYSNHFGLTADDMELSIEEVSFSQRRESNAVVSANKKTPFPLTEETSFGDTLTTAPAGLQSTLPFQSEMDFKSSQDSDFPLNSFPDELGAREFSRPRNSKGPQLHDFPIPDNKNNTNPKVTKATQQWSTLFSLRRNCQKQNS